MPLWIIFWLSFVATQHHCESFFPKLSHNSQKPATLTTRSNPSFLLSRVRNRLQSSRTIYSAIRGFFLGQCYSSIRTKIGKALLNNYSSVAKERSSTHEETFQFDFDFNSLPREIYRQLMTLPSKSFALRNLSIPVPLG